VRFASVRQAERRAAGVRLPAAADAVRRAFDRGTLPEPGGRVARVGRSLRPQNVRRTIHQRPVAGLLVVFTAVPVVV